MYVILIEDFLFFMILFGLVKYIYLNIYVVGGLLFGRGVMYIDFMFVLFSLIILFEKKLI